jgi:hypothetical protein
VVIPKRRRAFGDILHWHLTMLSGAVGKLRTLRCEVEVGWLMHICSGIVITMDQNTSFIKYWAVGMPTGLCISAAGIISAGAGHSKHVEFWIGAFKFGGIVFVFSAIAYVISFIVRLRRNAGRSSNNS